MMTADEGSAKINIDDYGSSRLLHDIEDISKALYLPPKTSIPPKYVKDDLLLNNKKSSIWKWKPLKALTHIRNHKLGCCFFLHIHSIEGLPLNFNDLSLCVHWKRKNEVLKSHSIRVSEGVAKIEETLIHRCSVYASKRGPHDDVAKYAPKLSLLYASIAGAPNLDIGKHLIDLTRLLPLTLTELEDEKNRYGKWLTSFKLSGKAKGATINVSFGFSLSGDSFVGPGNRILQRVGSVSSHSGRRTQNNEILPYEGPSMTMLYELLDDTKSKYSEELISESNDVYDGEFTVIDKGIEYSEYVEDTFIETINVADLFDDEVCVEVEAETAIDDISTKENNVCNQESNEDLELFLHSLSISDSQELDFSFHENQLIEHDYRIKNGSFREEGRIVKSRSLDDITNIVVDDLMNLIGGSDSEPESPRERLLKEFEKETLASGNFVYNTDVKEERKVCCNIFDSLFLFQKTEMEHDYKVAPTLISRRKAKMVENLETEALMEKWGLNERAFTNSPRTESGAFGSPVYLSPGRRPELPSLGDGLGSFLKTENGGFLRSMNPILFKKAKNGERLILQVSNAVVLPPEMGYNGVDILVKWAKVGPDVMLFQATHLMPLEEVTGKTLQQAAWKGESGMEVLERGNTLLHESEFDINSEHFSLENIIPLAIEKIQYLLIEGLRIQSRMSTEEPPATINSASTSNRNVKELVNMSISFDDWIKLDQHIGCFGNFTLVLQILLRDPLRDYEPVGIPMLALVQVERSTSVEPMFKVNEVHVTGFKVDFQKKQQSGTRWLHSSGLTAKTKKHSLTKSRALIRSSIRSMNTVTHEATLWSLCSYGEVSLYTRNPDIVFR
ncbi:plastid movement impaired 1-related 1-like protein isoform X1 [Tanacetum coccineum]|uniref:Plastid movement impaired 1-related 1-like protein isoform X1 n=1 Tax=Tanacetum coccineum TaxID=301880 RepID=A0ABQ5GG06_9ASTR